ncbi:MAG: hypothetical protein ACRD1X_01740 [Vicinamibacteria bacterium]
MRHRIHGHLRSLLFVGLVASAQLFVALPVIAQEASTQATSEDLPEYLKDRGTGVATSMFGTYIRRGEFLVYPFFEYYRDNNIEYSPEELGAVGLTDYRGRYRASEGLVFFGYGITEDLALEMEIAGISATFEKSPDDASSVPDVIKESGLGDVEGQLRWRWKRENERRPEFFSYFEFVFPHAEDKVLIGTPGWELKFGSGITRGTSWGTWTVRAAVEYDEASTSHFDLGEYAVEYLKRVSPTWRFYVGIEGASDELALVTEAQWFLTRNVFVKLNNGLGLTSKATDWAPEVGVVFSFGAGPID